ncbi:MAG: PQQ-binding-like beta-propeller repeat protein, partial [Planctomycetota bacterium]
GQQVFVDHGLPGRVQLAANLADAIWAGGANGPAEAELLRVLRPGGKAFVGAKELVKPAPAGTDPWSHPYHGPDNNPLSSDQLARAPYRTQFLAEPLFGCMPEVTVACGGRMFKAFGHISFKKYQNAVINTLYAMNAYNGATLWQRELRPGFMIHRNTLLASPEVLYLADDESCKLLDAATGQVKDAIVVAPELSDGPVWKWMALEDGVLYALAGNKEVEAPVQRGTDTRYGGWPWAMWPGYDYKDPRSAWGFGRTFLAFEPKTKKVLWSYRDEEFIDCRGVCMKNGKIWFYCPDKALGCLDAKTGKILWRTEAPELLSAIGPNGRAQDYRLGFATTVYLKTNGKLLFFAGPQRKTLVAVNTGDGKVAWQRPDGNFQLVLRDDAIYAAGMQGTKSFKLDYAAGQNTGEFSFRRACTRATGSVDSVFFRGTEGTFRWDMASNGLEHIAPMRPACNDGVIISDGLLHWGPWICGCSLSLFGAICLGPAGEDAQVQPDETSRLETGPGDPRAVKELRIDPTDWPVYQSDNSRSRTAKAGAPEKVKPAWEFKPASTLIPTAPVAASGMVLVAGTDGVVRALNAGDGKPLWKAFTGGAIYFPPALEGGRVYAGSNDGRVYAFEAATGRQLWRFRAGPAERKIPVYGEVASTWPVAGGVLVQDGTVYAAAGIAHYDGTHVWALDAVTGQPKWHNSTSGAVNPEVKNGVSVCGSLRLDGDMLAFHGGNVYTTAKYTLASGECPLQPIGPHTSQRVLLFPRRAWEPVGGGDWNTPAGVLRVALPPGPRVTTTVGLYPPGTPPPPQGPNKPKGPPPLWSLTLSSYQGYAMAGPTLLLLGRIQGKEQEQEAPPSLAALNIQDGSVRWTHALPAEAVPWGLAMDCQRRIFVALADGRVVAIGPADH